jgi:hypothetical protein
MLGHEIGMDQTRVSNNIFDWKVEEKCYGPDWDGWKLYTMISEMQKWKGVRSNREECSRFVKGAKVLRTKERASKRLLHALI